MDDEQFSDMIARVNKNKEDITPSFSQIIVITGVFITSLAFLYYILI